MSSKLSKILTAGILLIAVIAAFLFIRMYLNIGEGSDALNATVSPLVEFSAWLLYIVLIATVAFSIWNLFKHPETLKQIGINIGVLGAVYLICYLLASDAAVLDVQGQILEGGEKGSVSKLISTIINYSQALGIIAVGAVLAGTVKTAIK